MTRRHAQRATEGPRLRFAPSPTGGLHLGSAASALVNAELAKRWDGTFLVRIEDIDLGRRREQFIAAILDDLRWLGLTWEEPVLRQSEHFPRYGMALDALREAGLLYPCFATRSEIAAAVARDPEHPRDPDGAPVYPGLHKGLSADDVARRRAAGEALSWRLDMTKALARVAERCDGAPLTYCALDARGVPTRIPAAPSVWGDVVIARKDTPTSYHLSVVVDDAFQRITHVVRGQDLEAATSIHRVLQVLLGLPQPIYYHHGLILDSDGRKLSKSAGDTALSDLRAKGATPADIRARVATVIDATNVFSDLAKDFRL